jgi:hypothetical protein
MYASRLHVVEFGMVTNKSIKSLALKTTISQEENEFLSLHLDCHPTCLAYLANQQVEML